MNRQKSTPKDTSVARITRHLAVKPLQSRQTMLNDSFAKDFLTKLEIGPVDAPSSSPVVIYRQPPRFFVHCLWIDIIGTL